MKKRVVMALLALALALGLTACGKGEDKTAELAFQTAPYYTAEEIALPVETGELVGSCTDYASIWYLAIPGENEAPVLCYMPLNGGETEILTDYQPPAADEDTLVGYYGPFWGGDGKLWVWEQFLVYTYDLPEDFDQEKDNKDSYISGSTETFQLRQLEPATGKELQSVDITTAMKELDPIYLSGLVVDKEETVYLSDNRHIVAADNQGQVLFTLEEKLSGRFSPGSAGGKLVLLPDGTVAALTVQSGDKRAARSIDRDARDWGKRRYEIHSNTQEIYGGSGACIFCYTSGNVFYGVTDGEDLPQRLISWSHTPLTDAGNVMCIALLEEGQAAVLTCAYETNSDRYAGQIRAFRLLPSEDAPDDGKIRLICATIGDDPYLNYRIKKFNRNGTYYIELRDYAEGMLGYGEENPQIYDAAVARLYTDITSGRGPDILNDTLPLEALGRQGALEDLWPWIENDPDLGRETVMEHVLECMESDGKLYRICGGFAINTAVASADVAGDRIGWTVEEMAAAYGGQMPELYFGGNWDSRLIDVHFARFDKRSMLYNLTGMGLDRYVDWETGECSFDCEDFRSILALSGTGQDAEDVKMGYSPETSFYNVKSDVMEVCQVFPWEGKPILYARTLERPWDLVVDDVLFGGLDGLTNYEQQLWDAGILYPVFNSYQNSEGVGTHVLMESWKAIKSTIEDVKYGLSDNHPLAADYVVGGADGNTYASFVGFPTQSGTGSSFSVYDCASISATSEAKEGAWSFIRSLLRPGGNVLRRADDGRYPWVHGFPMDRAELESQLQPETHWCVDLETGETYLDGDGKKIQVSDYALGAGTPIVMMAYLFTPTQAQMDRFWDLYNAIDHIKGENDELLSIICEQAGPYFAGDKSLDETVQLIQNRAKLYISEHM